MNFDINEQELVSIEDFVDGLVDEGVGEEDELVDSYREFLNDTEGNE